MKSTIYGRARARRTVLVYIVKATTVGSPEELAVYKGPDLASTLLGRLGMIRAPPDRETDSQETAPPAHPKDVIRAIRDVAAELEEGEIQPHIARPRLYALQILLVPNADARGKRTATISNGPPQLEAVARNATPEPSTKTRFSPAPAPDRSRPPSAQKGKFP